MDIGIQGNNKETKIFAEGGKETWKGQAGKAGNSGKPYRAGGFPYRLMDVTEWFFIGLWH